MQISINIFESCKKKECSSVGGNWGNQGVEGDGSERKKTLKRGRGRINGKEGMVTSTTDRAN